MSRIRSVAAAFVALAALAAASMSPGNADAVTFTNVNLGAGVGEPGVALSPNGTVFVHVPAGSGRIWRGSGSSFTRTDNFDRLTIASGDTDVSVAPDDGAVYAINLAYGTFSNNVYVSRDNGATYSLGGIAGADSDRQWITAWRNGTSYVSYHDLAPLGAQNIWVMKSTDYGRTYVTRGNVLAGNPVALAESLTICGNVEDRVIVDPTDPSGNTIYVAYALGDAASCALYTPLAREVPINQAWVAKSTDGGITWNSTMISGSLLPGGPSLLHLFVNMAIDSAGNLYYVYSVTGPGTETHVKMQTSTNGGATWSQPYAVDQDASQRANVMPAVAAGASGRVDVIWYSTTASDFNNSSASWVVRNARSFNADSAAPTFAYSQVSSGVVHVGGICVSGLNCSVSGGNRRLLDFIDVEIDAAGVAHASWANDNNANRTVFDYYGRG